MKLATFAIAAVSLSSTVSAEVTKLGEFSLGQSLAKWKMSKGSVFGCPGSFGQKLANGKIVGVEFNSSKCKAADVEAAVKKEYGAAPIVSTDKTAKLWEGKTASVIVVSAISGGVTVKLVPPGPGAKRVCFADDGFAGFLKTFKASIDKPDAAAAMFAYPIKDFDGKVVIKDAKALAKKWPTLIDGDDKKELASGALVPTCTMEIDSYSLRLGNSNVSLEAKKIGDKWQWVEINDESPG